MHMENYQELSEFLSLETVQGRKDEKRESSPVTMIRTQRAMSRQNPHVEMPLAPALLQLFIHTNFAVTQN